MIGGISVDGPRPAGKDAARRDCGIRAGERAAPTWLQDRRRKPAYGWNEMSEKEGGEGRPRGGRGRVKSRLREREREEWRVAGRESAESTTEKDGERKSDGEERRRSLVALSTRAPPSSTSAPKTPTLVGRRGRRRGGGERYGDKRGGN